MKYILLAGASTALILAFGVWLELSSLPSKEQQERELREYANTIEI